MTDYEICIKDMECDSRVFHRGMCVKVPSLPLGNGLYSTSIKLICHSVYFSRALSYWTNRRCWFFRILNKDMNIIQQYQCLRNIFAARHLLSCLAELINLYIFRFCSNRCRFVETGPTRKQFCVGFGRKYLYMRLLNGLKTTIHR